MGDMPTVCSAAGSISINEINSIIPAAKPSANASRRLEGFWPIMPSRAPTKVAPPANKVRISGTDMHSPCMPIIFISF
ncbi:hypothetical protein D3C76_1247260 [compost metagenome]